MGQKYESSPLYGPRPELGTTDNGLPTALNDVGIDQKLNEQVPLDLVFRDESGREVILGNTSTMGNRWSSLLFITNVLCSVIRSLME